MCIRDRRYSTAGAVRAAVSNARLRAEAKCAGPPEVATSSWHDQRANDAPSADAADAAAARFPAPAGPWRSTAVRRLARRDVSAWNGGANAARTERALRPETSTPSDEGGGRGRGEGLAFAFAFSRRRFFPRGRRRRRGFAPRGLPPAAHASANGSRPGAHAPAATAGSIAHVVHSLHARNEESSPAPPPEEAPSSLAPPTRTTTNRYATGSEDEDEKAEFEDESEC